MALFHITIEKVIVKEGDDEIKKLLQEIKCLITDKEDEATKQQIMDKLDKAISDIKQTV